MYSALIDPAFYMHHALSDRIFWIWQALHPGEAKEVTGPLPHTNNPPTRNTTADDELIMECLLTLDLPRICLIPLETRQLAISMPEDESGLVVGETSSQWRACAATLGIIACIRTAFVPTPSECFPRPRRQSSCLGPTPFPFPGQFDYRVASVTDHDTVGVPYLLLAKVD